MPGFSAGGIAIAICDRCRVQYPYPKLMADGNNPGLRVCRGCRDNLDPYKLPPRQPDTYVLRNPRPDVALTVDPWLLDENGQLFEANDEDYFTP